MRKPRRVVPFTRGERNAQVRSELTVPVKEKIRILTCRQTSASATPKQKKRDNSRAKLRPTHGGNMADNKKCAHPACSCQAREGSNYCSTYCEGAGKTPEITCQCGHPGCSGKV